MNALRGYVVSGPYPAEGALLVWAGSSREAKRMGWRTVVEEYQLCFYPEVQVRWLRDADPAAWGIDRPCFMEPQVCQSCELWQSVPLNDEGLCEGCVDDAEMELDLAHPEPTDTPEGEREPEGGR